MSTKKSAVQRQRARLETMAQLAAIDVPALSDLHKRALPLLIADGATLTWLCEQPGMPSTASVHRARKDDPAFDAAMRDAMALHAAAILSTAQDYANEAIDDADFDKAKRAEILHRISVARAEKVAPKEYGQLVKHADADGGKLSISVVNYATAPNVPSDQNA